MRFNFLFTGWEVGLEPKAPWQIPGKNPLALYYHIALGLVVSVRASINPLSEQEGMHLITVFSGT